MIDDLIDFLIAFAKQLILIDSAVSDAHTNRAFFFKSTQTVIRIGASVAAHSLHACNSLYPALASRPVKHHDWK